MLREDLATAARDLRTQTNMDRIPVPVFDIANSVVDVFGEQSFSEGIDGMAVHSEDGTIIAINRNITSRGRKRFTVGHELGHIRLHEGRFDCLMRDIATNASGDPRERQANQFAAELLMPEREFFDVVPRSIPSWETILAAADRTAFDVSITAAALRAVTLSDGQCLLVSIASGRIEWCAHSEFLDVWTRRSEMVPRDSAAARAMEALPLETFEGYGDACDWLDDDRIEEDVFYFEEESICIGGGRALVLLLPDDEIDFDELVEHEE